MYNLRSYALSASLILLLGAGACASSGSGGSSGDPDRLTREQIMSVDQPTLYEVVQRLRPRWTRSRGQRGYGSTPSVVVYQNQTYLGGLDALRQLTPGSAAEMRYLDAAEAMASLPGLGSQRIQGAIVIYTTEQRR